VNGRALRLAGSPPASHHVREVRTAKRIRVIVGSSIEVVGLASGPASIEDAVG